MPFGGAGTQSSPIAVEDDSEDEVFYELSKDSSPSIQDIPRPPSVPPITVLYQDKKRKRANSFTSQDIPIAGPSNGRQPHPSLVNRLSVPESKKARKRRRRAERQAKGEAGLKNSIWNIPIPERPPAHMYGVWPFLSTQAGPSYPYNLDDNYESPSLDWVSSMALAAGDDPGEELSSWSPLSTQVLPPLTTPPFLPPNPPLPAPSPPPLPPPQIIHALPPKPPPPPMQTIGMMPDQDPNSKHGTFDINASNKEAGTDMKKRNSQYIPNPARTLVMEKLPKTHRHPDFINNWSRSACGYLPVHIFIDGPREKALIEFSAAELARKAWASPRLGTHAGLKSHQLKGKPREDLIKVWWYRVDGVGAGSGVGEIEEGEIEGDAAEKEIEPPPKTETKKERKARLAKEREEKKRKIREAELKSFQENLPYQSQQVQQRQQPSAPLQNQKQQYKEAMNAALRPQQKFASSSLPHPFIPNHPNMKPSLHSNGLTQGLNPLLQFPPVSLPYPSLVPSYSSAWNSALPVQMPNPTSTASILKAAYEASLRQAGHADNDDQDSIASSAGSFSTPAEALVQATNPVASRTGQADDLSDFEDDMEVDVDERAFARLVHPPPPHPLSNAKLPLHSSLPPRPGVMVARYATKPLPPKQPPPPLPSPTFSSGSDSQSYSQNMASDSRGPTLPVIAPQPKAPRLFTAQELSGQATASLPSPTTTPAQSSSSASSTTSTTPIPSEPKAMKNAPTEPSYTKRALMARQKELEEKIAKSKLELAATAAAKSGVVSGSGTPTATTISQPLDVVAVATPATTPRPSMDLGEKQAMEDRLRKLVLQSQKARGRGKVEASVATTTASAIPLSDPPTILMTTTPTPLPQQQQNRPHHVPDSSSSSPATVSISSHSHSFSLEDMAVSFITQTIETIKAQPAIASPQVVSSAVGGATRPPPTSNSNVRLELAAKQKRLQDHISESKALMAKLSLARSKEEKDGIMKVIRESSRLFEEGSHAAQATSSLAPITEGKLQTPTPPQQFQMIRWPNSHQDAGVLILSDEEDDSDFDDD